MVDRGGIDEGGRLGGESLAVAVERAVEVFLPPALDGDPAGTALFAAVERAEDGVDAGTLLLAATTGCDLPRSGTTAAARKRFQSASLPPAL